MAFHEDNISPSNFHHHHQVLFPLREIGPYLLAILVLLYSPQLICQCIKMVRKNQMLINWEFANVSYRMG